VSTFVPSTISKTVVDLVVVFWLFMALLFESVL
jgi:hypothetical protein